MKVGVVGAGYVGLTTAVCLAERNHDTVCVDIDSGRVARLAGGVVPVDEPGLPELLGSGLRSGTLRFSENYDELADREVVFVCVPTPRGADGSADLSAVDAAVGNLAEVLGPGAVLAMKSTVPVGTTRRLSEQLGTHRIRAVSNPEFLRESHAVYDFRHPDRILIGAEDDTAAETMEQLYGAAAGEAFRMSPESAELAKYASNAFLAVKISYANSLAQLCARVGADIGDVTRCMGADIRIGPHFLQPGPGWGGSCLPKDTAELLHTGRSYGVELAEVSSACRTNGTQSGRIVDALCRAVPVPLAEARITALGLTFKAGTCDVRDSPALAICGDLSGAGAQIAGYDPRLDMMDHGVLRRSGVAAVDDPYRATKDADAIVVFTEWPEFREVSWVRVAERAPSAVVVDTRNILDPDTVTAAGLRYLGNGRPGGF
ncbi:UDP-glucose dehydrogenase family protein [Mycolicibacterium fortuitum]|uniref:UDP-glucose 6-dehydrogenase n=1 Tax=Mycolicibacterium fortuitum subsp. fortuitum DSM 46621 = ATCC 6841 = JCM 6387 TaxID=1214102 RepID=K0V140_MYCFO|nr:UDP-glucose/GDP-mannose dehydrogenase family protein [Mycolicibacterium fortuitum]AIY45688.1 UDP-glucose dehydrogenase [Mycobacterium sp. VKM Ac-1817D]CRL80056.1 UDP-glucose 6-dehydrogenase [Mycolicibacter nonchromogenicus]EJZ13077.1 UDP-glucose 6-dehydrogenase [Mycolicibacterium fortuitum subsp. fortuitum DSM 46621 = ATCC 6841 = JCM 6387]WEV34521.1 UDP-glucose/GDP-mannose dehydrogenase family protein [Mycolicibacterium fortuitum]BDD97754.1 UDP-glucose 6-dehydrogenase [Mycolicibacterium for